MPSKAERERLFGNKGGTATAEPQPQVHPPVQATVNVPAYCQCNHGGLDQGRISAILGSRAECLTCGLPVRAAASSDTSVTGTAGPVRGVAPPATDGRCATIVGQKRPTAGTPIAVPQGDAVPSGEVKVAQKARAIVRLPAGSIKRPRWDGSLWRGTLTVPLEGNLEKEFGFEADSERNCFHGLHDAYEKWLQGDGAPPGG